MSPQSDPAQQHGPPTEAPDAIRRALAEAAAAVSSVGEDDVLDIGLELRQVSAGVMFLHERTTEVDPLEHDGLAAEIGERDGLALEILGGELRSGLADFLGIDGDQRESTGDSSVDDGFHRDGD